MFRPFGAPLRSRLPRNPLFPVRTHLLLLLLLIAASVSPLSSFSAPSASAAATSTDLATAVRLTAGALLGAVPESIIVETVEAIDDWAYGTATAPAGADDSPAVKFFLAHRLSDGAWQVELRFTDAFAELLASAPASFPSAAIRTSLEGTFDLAGIGHAQLSFPFPAGETWTFLGPHEGSPWRALDFTAGDGSVNDPVGTVTAMRGGSVYRPCGGLVMIDHGDGWATGYYHVDQVVVSNGETVARGQAIGFTSRNYDCGGYAASNHVHVWTEFRGVSIAIGGQDIGGWTVENGPGEYYGCLVKGSDRRCRLPNGTWNNTITNTSDVGSGGLATVDISGAVGRVGDQIDFVLQAFPAGSSVNISWRRPGGSTVDLGSVTTTAAGGHAGQLTIPATTNGDLNLVTFAAGDVTRTVRITVFPKVIAQPATVEPGDSITVTLSGFPKQTSVSLTAVSGFEHQIPLGSVTTNNTGGGQLTVTVPNGLPNGSATIDATAPGDIYAQADIEVSGSGTVTGPPSATVTPTRNTVNNWLALTVSSFPANSTVSVTWIRTSGGSIEVATLQTDGNGAAAGQVRVPATPGGLNSIRFSSGSVNLTLPFEVVPRIKVIPGDVERGATVDISLRGFGKKETVRVRWRNPQGQWIELAQVVTSNTGSANLLVAVPNWAADSANSVRGDGTTFRAQTNAVTVSGGVGLADADTAESPTPTETAIPDEVTPTPEVSSPDPDATPTAPATGTPEPTNESEPTPIPTEPAPEQTPEPPPTDGPVNPAAED